MAPLHEAAEVPLSPAQTTSTKVDPLSASACLFITKAMRKMEVVYDSILNSIAMVVMVVVVAAAVAVVVAAAAVVDVAVF
jgi:hypothetical protein